MAEELKLKLGKKEMMAISLLIIMIFFFYVFNFTGLKLIIGAILLFFLPFYLIIDCFDFSTAEKVFFAFFIGLPIFSSAVYTLGFVLGLRISIIILFILLIIISVLLRKRYKKKLLKFF